MKNEGSLDRFLRTVIGVVAVIVAVATGGAWSVVWWVVAALALITAAVGFCPLYRLVGINTCKR
ncbi:MAG: DUF2892 domain-containing protein [Acidobacteria bacterium]|nr:DUF2892 domain-containing protein [Acidobacteriota bacterium]